MVAALCEMITLTWFDLVKYSYLLKFTNLLTFAIVRHPHRIPHLYGCRSGESGFHSHPWCKSELEGILIYDCPLTGSLVLAARTRQNYGNLFKAAWEIAGLYSRLGSRSLSMGWSVLHLSCTLMSSRSVDAKADVALPTSCSKYASIVNSCSTAEKWSWGGIVRMSDVGTDARPTFSYFAQFAYNTLKRHLLFASAMMWISENRLPTIMLCGEVAIEGKIWIGRVRLVQPRLQPSWKAYTDLFFLAPTSEPKLGL